MAIPKGFIPIKDGWINVNNIDKDKCYFDEKMNKAVIFDTHGNKYCIDKKVLKGKMEIKNGKQV